MTDFIVESKKIYNEGDFQLTDLTVNDVGTVTGEINLPEANNEQFATLSFRQTVNGTDMIEIKAINVLNVSNGSDPDYETNLTVGDYRVVASSIGYNTVFDNFPLTNAGTILPDLDFTAAVP
jgi:hypothetical protein